MKPLQTTENEFSQQNEENGYLNKNQSPKKSQNNYHNRRQQSDGAKRCCIMFIIMLVLLVSSLVIYRIFTKKEAYSHNFKVSIQKMILRANLQMIFQTQRQQNKAISKDQFIKAISKLQITDNASYGGQIKLNMTQKDSSESQKLERIRNLINQQTKYLEQKYKISEYKQDMQLPFCVIVLAQQNYASGLYQRNLKSIFMQNYTNYRVLYVDNASPDRTGQYVPCYLPSHSIPKDKIEVILNEKRKQPLENIYEMVFTKCTLGQIAVIIQADDAFIGTNVLSLYNAIYQRDKCAMAYSSHLSVQNDERILLNISKQIPQDILRQKKLRTIQQSPGKYLLSFYVDVFRSIYKRDFQNQHSQFFSHAYQTALIIPLLEISFPRISVVKEILYEHRIHLDDQNSISEIKKQTEEILAKNSYNPLKFFPFIERAKYKYFFDIEIDKVIQNSDFGPYKAEENFTHEGCTKDMHIRAIQMTDIIHSVKFGGEVAVELAQFQTSKQQKQKRILKLLEEDRQYYNQKYEIDQYQKKKQLPFCIVITCYNNVKNGLYMRNLDSIFMQNYTNYHVVYIDDASPEKTGQHVYQYLEKKNIPKNKIEIIINKQNKRALTNIYSGVHKCKQRQIVALVDGDDSLIGRNILPLFNAIYQKEKVAIAYSNFLTIHNNDRTQLGFCHPPNLEKLQQNRFREDWNLVGSHLMTFYSDLFKKIKLSDLTYENGTFLYFAYDRAILTPMLQMAYPRIRVVSQLTYEYRNDTGANEATDDWSKDSRIVLDRKPYEHLEDFPFIYEVDIDQEQKEAIGIIVDDIDTFEQPPQLQSAQTEEPQQQSSKTIGKSNNLESEQQPSIRVNL